MGVINIYAQRSTILQQRLSKRDRLPMQEVCIRNQAMYRVRRRPVDAECRKHATSPRTPRSPSYIVRHARSSLVKAPWPRLSLSSHPLDEGTASTTRRLLPFVRIARASPLTAACPAVVESFPVCFVLRELLLRVIVVITPSSGRACDAPAVPGRLLVRVCFTSIVIVGVIGKRGHGVRVALDETHPFLFRSPLHLRAGVSPCGRDRPRWVQLIIVRSIPTRSRPGAVLLMPFEDVLERKLPPRSVRRRHGRLQVA